MCDLCKSGNMEIFILTTLLLLLVFYSVKVKKYKLPPGPRKVPIFGCLPFISLKKGFFDFVLGDQVTQHKLATIQLGPIGTIYFINDYELAKDLFNRDEFNGRNPNPMALNHKYFNKVPQGIIQTQGNQWSTQRRFALKTLKDFGFGKKSIENSIHFEVEEMIESFLSHDEKDFTIGLDFNVPIINILWQMVANSRFTEDDPEGMEMLEAVSKIFTGARSFNIPYRVQKLFRRWNSLGERIANNEKIRDYLLSIVKDHQKDHSPKNERDFIDVYLTEILKDDTGENYNQEELVGCIQDFFLAGTETSSTTLKWIVLYLTLHPDVQQKCREEIRQEVGQGKVSVADMPSLPYLQATISEIQRVSRVAPASLLHSTKRATEVDGFTFPPRSAFMANLSFMMSDPKYFDKPEQFNPSRFITEDGRFRKVEQFVPFSLGKRYCMGEMLARNEMFIFTATLVQQLKFLPPLHHPPPNPENYICNLTRIPDDFSVRAVRV